jgi:hypothetical protein
MTVKLHARAGARLLDDGRATEVERLWLRATGDSWSLMNSDGEVLFYGQGLAGRRECLDFARSVGALCVLS